MILMMCDVCLHFDGISVWLLCDQLYNGMASSSSLTDYFCLFHCAFLNCTQTKLYLANITTWLRPKKNKKSLFYRIQPTKTTLKQQQQQHPTDQATQSISTQPQSTSPSPPPLTYVTRLTTLKLCDNINLDRMEPF
jgi:mRNA deadenylase 3'-5' endonuclease subunit Ccr4